MVAIVVKHDLDKIRRALRKYPKAVKFAQKRALDATAYAIKRTEDRQVSKYIDRPTRFTQNLTKVGKAHTSNLTAVVFIPDRKNSYMSFHIHGGTERKGRAIAVPIHAKKNAYGNLTKANQAAATLRKPKHFSGSPGGRPAGVWQRIGKGSRETLKLMHLYKPSLTYHKRFPFFRIAQSTAKNVLPKNMDKEIKSQLAYINRTA